MTDSKLVRLRRLVENGTASPWNHWHDDYERGTDFRHGHAPNVAVGTPGCPRLVSDREGTDVSLDMPFGRDADADGVPDPWPEMTNQPPDEQPLTEAGRALLDVMPSLAGGQPTARRIRAIEREAAADAHKHLTGDQIAWLLKDLDPCADSVAQVERLREALDRVVRGTDPDRWNNAVAVLNDAANTTTSQLASLKAEDYEAWVTRVADALHETCRLEWQAIRVVDPERQLTQHGPDAHYGMAHDLVRRLGLASLKAEAVREAAFRRLVESIRWVPITGEDDDDVSEFAVADPGAYREARALLNDGNATADE